MNCDELISRYGRHVGLKDLSFDTNNIAILNINQHFLFIITKINTNEALLNLCVCPLNQEEAEESALFLLNLNMSFINSSGAFLYWNDEGSVLCLSKVINSTAISDISLNDLITNMVFDAKDTALKINSYLNI